ncbi:heme ABC transporter substrate-binding protein IsdE [Paenibacillus massiliensis]|uniref:heme ABC transporter substrate-binding protein IsdE n=1 Tax=Paenibacillus massiliensis TaxID=225917 RepID=UPI000425ED6A|nr:heme ABC transporter substrate-binding protein IsdE [Paenibacillus massiliensis]
MLSKQRFSKIHGLSVLLLLLVLVGCGGTPTAGQVDQQAEETASSSSAQEHRIVSTTVAVTEIMDALEIDLVGVPTSTKTLPARYDGLTPIGNPMSPDMEVVKSLRPTEVLSVSTLQYDLQPTFEKFGIKADFLNLQSLGNMEETITRLGQTYDREEQATALISRYEEKRAQIEQAVAGKDKPKVLILLGVPGSYLVATENSFIGDLVKLAGGENIVQNENVEYLASNTEYLQQANPDVILRAAHGMPDEVVKMFNQEFATNDIWKHFSAVQNGRVYDLEESLFGTTANLAADQALDELQKMLYP